MLATIRSHRTVAITLAIVLALALAAGVAWWVASTRAQAAQEQAQQQAEQAQAAAAKQAETEAFRESEKIIRGYLAATSANPMKVVSGPTIDPELVRSQQEFIDALKKQDLTMRGTSEVLSVTPTHFTGSPANEATMKVCSKIAGGVYDSSGKNVTTDPDGNPINDKERRVPTTYLTRQGEDGQWRILSETTETGSC